MTPEERAGNLINELAPITRHDTWWFKMFEGDTPAPVQIIAAAIREAETAARSAAFEEAAKVAELYTQTEMLSPQKCASVAIASAIRDPIRDLKTKGE